MKDIPITDVRNFVLLGHTGSGKTQLLDAILFKLGVNDRLGHEFEIHHTTIQFENVECEVAHGCVMPVAAEEHHHNH